MPEKDKYSGKLVEEENLETLVALLTDPKTNITMVAKIATRLVESRENAEFFDVIMEQMLDHGACPCCGHENHWAIPESELNIRGEVSAHKDKRVKVFTTEEDCHRWHEACAKRKLTF